MRKILKIKRKKFNKYVIVVSLLIIAGSSAFSYHKIQNILVTRIIDKELLNSLDVSDSKDVLVVEILTPPKKTSHITVPSSVKAIYMSAWVASGREARNKIIKMVDETDANAVVIDIKDYTGKISFVPTTESLANAECFENKIKDLDSFIEELHKKNIYVIGRIATFQDPCLVSKNPGWAVKHKGGGIWKDKKGITWLDASNKASWEYFVDLSKESYDRGFDEVNFDYIRFPTDGDMEGMRFSGLASSTKPHAIRDFLKYIDLNLRGGLGANYIRPKIVKAVKPANSSKIASAKGAVPGKTDVTVGLNASGTTEIMPEIVTPPAPFATSTLGSKVYNIPEFNAPTNRLMVSADVFGLVTEALDDMGIGQNFEDMLPYLDYMSPMVYPSHYAKGYNGFPNPAKEPYKVVYSAMSHGVARAKTMGQNPLKLRPWLQDFDMGATYTPAMLTAQMKAVSDSQLDGFLLWDPANRYKAGAVALKNQ